MSADLVTELVTAARSGDDPRVQKLVVASARAHPARLVEAALRLHARPSLGAAREGTLLERIEQSLATTPGAEQAMGAMELARSWFVDPEEKKDGRYWARAAARGRKLASLLAASQPIDVLLELLDRFEHVDGHFEMLGLLVHEMVLAGVPGADHPVLGRLEREMRGRGHPLADLPLELLALEEGLPRPPEAPRPWRVYPVDRAPHPWNVQEVTREEDREAILSISEGHPAGSLGFEARVFLYDPPVEEEMTGELIDSFGLEALSSGEVGWAPVEAGRALARLFRFAGGGAWGRLAAWRSFAGLMGDRFGGDLSALERLAEACRWRFFTDWEPTEGVALLDCLLCVRPTGSSAAVLAELPPALGRDR